MKTGGKYFILSLQIYPFDIMVSLDEPDDKLFKRLFNFGIDKKDCERLLIMPETTNGRCVMFANNKTVIRLKRRNRYSMIGTISHESFHAACFILEEVGVKMEMSISDEVYAYLTGYITSEICKRFKL